MSRHRAYSTPASPTPSPALHTSSRIQDPFFPSISQQVQAQPILDRRERSEGQYTERQQPRALTEASLAALTQAAGPSTSTRQGAPAQPSRYPYPYGDVPFSLPGPGDAGFGYDHPVPRPSATPSTTSVSDQEDEEDGEGYIQGQNKEDRVEVRKWMDRKGKGKERAVEMGHGRGMAGSLPEEVLMQIFRHVPTRNLSTVMLVSRNWCLSAFPLLYSRLSITSTPQLASLARILTAPPSSLSLPYATHIRRINLNHIASSLTPDLFTPLAACVRLERIVMVGSVHISAGSLRGVLENVPELIAIDLANTPGVDDSVMKTLGRRCRRLQGLNISGCKSVGDEGVKAVAKGCKMLRRMKVAGCHRLTDDSLIHLVRLCPLILELDLAGVPQLRDTSIYAMWLNSIHLRELKLGKIANLTSGAFPDLPLLYSEQDDEVLNLSNPGWIAYLERAADIAIASPILSSLDGRRNRALTVDSYIDHGRDRDRRSTPDPNFLRPLAPIFDLLRVIDLTGCTELEDPALACLVNSAPKLRSLTLAKCAKLTDRGMSSVARLGKQLHHLHLGHVELITDAAVTEIARSCTRLRYVDVACCPLLTDLSVFELSSNLLKIRRIGLVKVVNLTDEGVYALAERNSSLERIHLSYCDNISVRAITFLLNRLMKLSHLSLTGVKAFRNEEVHRFRKAAPAEFTEHQSASFCVFSYHGINALRHYLNAVQSAQTAGSDTTTTRRGSGSSASSLTVPGPGFYSGSGPGAGGDDGGVYVGPAYWSLEPGAPSDDPTPILARLARNHRWAGMDDRAVLPDSSRRVWRGSSAAANRERGQAQGSGPMFGDQVYRRVSTPTLPVPPAGSAPTSDTAVRAWRGDRPRGPRENGVRSTLSVDHEGISRSMAGLRMGEQEQRVPGEYPRERERDRQAGPVWGQQGRSGMLWSYGAGDQVWQPPESRYTASRARDGVGQSTSGGGYRWISDGLPELGAPIPPTSTSSTSVSRLRYQTSAQPLAPASAHRDNRASTGIYDPTLPDGYYSYEPAAASSTYYSQVPSAPSAYRPTASSGMERERSSSVSSALITGLAGRLRRPSLSVPVSVSAAVEAVGDVAAPGMRWVAEMVGWAGDDSQDQNGRGGAGGRRYEQGEREGEGPRGERR